LEHQLYGYAETALGISNPITVDTDKLSARAQRPPAFGPVIERVLPDAEEKPGYEALDLRTGNFLSLPEPPNDDLMLAWLKTNRADFIAAWDPDPEDSNKIYLQCIKIRLSDFDIERWTNATPQECLVALKSSTTLQPIDENSMDEDFTKAGATVYLLPPKHQLPRTLAFQTREGISGLLQITGFTDKPRGVKVRYKLVQGATPQANQTNTVLETSLSFGPGTTSVTTRPSPAPDYTKALSVFYAAAGSAEFLDSAIKKHDNPKLASETALQMLERLREYNQIVKGTSVEVPAKEMEAWAKVPAALNAGRWDEAASLMEESSLGESLLPKLEELAQNQTTGTINHYFAPAVELELPFEGKTPETACLDFDTGKMLNLPKKLTIAHSYMAWARWFVETGADVYAENRRSGPVIWGEPGCAFFPEETDKWENLTAPQLIKDLTKVSFIPEAEMKPGSLPATFLFKTRQHGIGIFQVTGFSTNKHGLNLRYKIAKNESLEEVKEGP
jgi:hypothetical protein